MTVRLEAEVDGAYEHAAGAGGADATVTLRTAQRGVVVTELCAKSAKASRRSFDAELISMTLAMKAIADILSVCHLKPVA